MTFEAWPIFALFGLVFAATQRPNAFNCTRNAMTRDRGRSFQRLVLRGYGPVFQFLGCKPDTGKGIE